MKNLSFESDEILDKEQLKFILGGYEPECPNNECQSDSDCANGTCETFNMSASCPEGDSMRNVCIPNT